MSCLYVAREMPAALGDQVVPLTHTHLLLQNTHKPSLTWNVEQSSALGLVLVLVNEGQVGDERSILKLLRWVACCHGLQVESASRLVCRARRSCIFKRLDHGWGGGRLTGGWGCSGEEGWPTVEWRLHRHNDEHKPTTTLTL